MRVYWSAIKNYVTGDFDNPLVTRDKNMMRAFMRVYNHRFGKNPNMVSTIRKNGIKSLSADAPGGWLVMYFERQEKGI